MTNVLKLVILVLIASQAEASITIHSCEQLWQMIPTLQEKNHPVIDSFGVIVPGIALKELTFTNGDPFIPGSDLESNCYLDRALDERSKKAIKAGAVAAARQRTSSPEEVLDFINRAINDEFRKGHSDDDGDLYTLRVEIDTLFKIHNPSIWDPGRFQLFANTQGIYSQRTIVDYVLISYIRHLGGWDGKFSRILSYLINKDREFRPPTTFKITECEDPLEYRWGIDGALVEDSYKGLSSNNVVHFGLCRKKQTVWSYHYTLGWWELKGQALKDFCRRAPMKLGLFDEVCGQ